jgi:predicted small secreted protein
MQTINLKKPAALLLSAILLAGCGGGNRGGGGAVDVGNGGGVNPPQAGAPDDIGASVAALLSYMERLIAGDENSDAVDINGVTLAVDDAAESS